MNEPKRSPEQTAISISIEKTLLEDIDDRANSLGLNRSNYLANLARQDLAKMGPFTLYAFSSEKKTKADKPNSALEAATKASFEIVRKKALDEARGQTSATGKPPGRAASPSKLSPPESNQK